MNSADRKARFEAIAATGCCVCRLRHGYITTPHIHHAVGIKYRAMGKKADDRHTYGLCPFHHEGQMGIHRMGLRAWEAAFYPQDVLLEYTDKIVEEYRGRH